MSDKPTYTTNDCGCYVDGARGIYAIDAIASFAQSHGMIVEDCDAECKAQHQPTCDTSRFAGCEFAGELEDKIDDWMNDNYPVDGASWGRSEQGDWGLWEHEAE